VHACGGGVGQTTENHTVATVSTQRNHHAFQYLPIIITLALALVTRSQRAALTNTTIPGTDMLRARQFLRTTINCRLGAHIFCYIKSFNKLYVIIMGAAASLTCRPEA
jgi:hypothetical protein